MNSTEQLELHKNSPKHLKKAERNMSFNSEAMMPSNVACNREKSGHKIKERNGGTESSSDDVPVIVTHQQTWYRCEICNKNMNTLQQWSMHTASPAHKKLADKSLDLSGGCQLAVRNNVASIAKDSLPVETLDRKQAADPKIQASVDEFNKDERFWCKICCKQMNSDQQWKDHIEGATHLKKLRLKAPVSIGADRSKSAEIQDSSNLDKKVQELKCCPQLPVPCVAVSSDKLPKALPSCSAASFISANIPESQMNVCSQSQSLQAVKEVFKGHESLKMQLPSQPMTASWTLLYRRPGFRCERSRKKCERSSAVQVNASGTERMHQQIEVVVNMPCGDANHAVKCIESDQNRQIVTEDYFGIIVDCEHPQCTYHCLLCDAHLTSDDVRNMHLEGKQHVSNIKRQQNIEQATVSVNPCGAHFPYYCSLCLVPFNTLKDKMKHEKGQSHAAKALRCIQVPVRELPELVKVLAVEDVEASCSTTSTPRKYQVELYQKAMKLDSICFLPTGWC
jgi:hypothetical protein